MESVPLNESQVSEGAGHVWAQVTLVGCGQLVEVAFHFNVGIYFRAGGSLVTELGGVQLEVKVFPGNEALAMFHRAAGGTPVCIACLAVEASLVEFWDVGDFDGKLLRLEVNVIFPVMRLRDLDIKSGGGVDGDVQSFTEAWH